MQVKTTRNSRRGVKSANVIDRESPAKRANGAHKRLPKEADAREFRLFKSLDLRGHGEILVSDLLDVLARVGLGHADFRLHETMKMISQYAASDRLTYDSFCNLIRPNILLIEQTLQGNLIIPDFQEFGAEIKRIYDATKRNREGLVADYIPQLARVNPELFGVALCTIDGQKFAIGDSKTDFSVQSCCKPVIYSLALEEHGADAVHRYVGWEPSGHNFNELTLSEGRPHNPMINAGAILCASLIRPDLDSADRFDYFIKKWNALCGNQKVQFNNSVYQSERKTADRNFALGYYMREHQAFPENADLIETLEFYFQSCSIELSVEMMSVIAATLANGGVCPVTGERILRTKNVQHCLALMSSCGMYDFSGEFAFTIGLPAKSGVGGAIMAVIPNVMGLCVWSPRLDQRGNSVRGIEFCKQLVQTFNFHNYDNLTDVSEKTDPRVNRIRTEANKVSELIWAASKGDHGAIHRLIVRGFDQNAADYDKRTPLHLAAAEGREHVVRYFIENDAEANPKDRWGGTPLDDAYRHGHTPVVKLLEQNGGIRGKSENDKNHNPHPKSAVNLPSAEAESEAIVELIYAASEGDLSAIQRLVARGINLAGADYDLRTPLHLAAAEGQEQIVQYFIDQGVPLSPRDRWGGTPMIDARRHDHEKVARLLKSQGARI